MPRKSITYRDLRNTPGMVFEQLSAGEPLSLVSEGEAKAVLIPVEDGDVETALEAYRRGRAFIALARMQRAARAACRAGLSIDDINAEVNAMRKARRQREQAG